VEATPAAPQPPSAQTMSVAITAPRYRPRPGRSREVRATGTQPLTERLPALSPAYRMPSRPRRLNRPSAPPPLLSLPEPPPPLAVTVTVTLCCADPPAPIQLKV
jgi:hypothetical protein